MPMAIERTTDTMEGISVVGIFCLCCVLSVLANVLKVRRQALAPRCAKRSRNVPAFAIETQLLVFTKTARSVDQTNRARMPRSRSPSCSKIGPLLVAIRACGQAGPGPRTLHS